MLDESELLADCEIRRQRRSGPGGQHRNKVETAVIITHTPTGIQGEATERRSQEQNRQVAIFRLRLNLAIKYRTDTSSELYKPSELWLRRCRKQRIAINSEHDDFPAILAEALNVLAAHGWESKESASALGCSPSQLVKLLKLEPQAFVELNRRRGDLGLKPLK